MYDVVKTYDKVSAEWIEKYSKIEESASINECMEVSGAFNHDFRPVWPGARAVGAALTVRARAGDNLIIHKAISMIKPGDILVVTCDGFQESGGMFGGIMSTSSQHQGAAGLIIDGCVPCVVPRHQHQAQHQSDRRADQCAHCHRRRAGQPR